MNNFWHLVGFEYKKIFMKKSTVIAITLSVLVTIMGCVFELIGNEYVDGQVVGTKYEGILRDREYDRALAGGPIDGDLIMEASKAYQMIPKDVNDYTRTEEYQQYARPYSGIFEFARAIYAQTTHGSYEYMDFQNITREQADSLYDIRNEKIREDLRGENLSINEHSAQKLLNLSGEVQNPIIFQYIDGYGLLFSVLYTSGLLAAFCMAICIAPIFSGEYQGADQLILSSKNGKKSVIYAKLFTGFSVSVLFAILLYAATYIPCMIYGLDGANAALQLMMPMELYPLTMGEVSILFLISIVFSCIFVCGVTMFLSSRFKSPFYVIIVISLLLVIPMFLNVPQEYRFLYRLDMLLPTNMMAFWNVTSTEMYEFLGMSVQPYIFAPIAVFAISLLLLPPAYMSFKNHQVS